MSTLDESRVSSAHTRKDDEASTTGNQPQDWSILWSCFENPLSLLTVNGGLPKNMKEMVSNAVSEMRRYYSRKVIDVLIKITRASLDALRKQFIVESDDDAMKPKKTATIKQKPIFLVYSTLMIPNIAIKPTLEELQEALIAAGRNITGVSKGVAQWTSGKEVCTIATTLRILFNNLFLLCSPRKAIFDQDAVMSKMKND